MATVYVGLSGGVDSAVSAALLKEQGHTVVGCFIKIWQPEFTECTWREDRLDAMRVCAALKIPYREIDLSEEYKHEVVEDMVANYRKGITPNPDVLCNTTIKFGFFARWAFGAGAEFVATGHYAQNIRRGDIFSLERGIDADKDQSYFLWQLTQDQLARTLFPVGGFTKQVVRKKALEFQLPVARKHDSQGLCFVGDISLPEFLSRYIPLQSGNVIDALGNVIGTHDGAALYTPGQRHGFTVHSAETHAPHYVIRTDIQRNTVTVSTNKRDAMCKTVILTHEQFSEPPYSDSICVQIRYRERAEPAMTSKTSTGIMVTFSTPRIAARGQSLVWYAGNRVIGGGVIDECLV